MKPEQAYHTGQLAHLKREVLARFNVRVETGQTCVFVEPGVISQLLAMVVPAAN